MQSESKIVATSQLHEKTLNWLMYRSYEFNRDRSPHVEPSRWRKLYLNQETYEKIYQERKL